MAAVEVDLGVDAGTGPVVAGVVLDAADLADAADMSDDMDAGTAAVTRPPGAA